MDEFLFFDAAIQKLGVGKPRPKIPWTFVEREAESMIGVTIDQFIHLYGSVPHPDKRDILRHCAGMGLEYGRDLRGQTQAGMSAHSGRPLECAVRRRAQPSCCVQSPHSFVSARHILYCALALSADPVSDRVH